MLLCADDVTGGGALCADSRYGIARASRPGPAADIEQDVTDPPAAASVRVNQAGGLRSLWGVPAGALLAAVGRLSGQKNTACHEEGNASGKRF